MVTTIKISDELKEKLDYRKISEDDTYENVIWELLEDTLELNEQTKREIAEARKQFERGEYISHSEMKKKLGL
ncbi:MAG: hypothetical protein ACMXYL_03950 [Candidatus Woesearchaeota archaeon]